MIKDIIASGKDIIEAQENARAALGAGELEDVKFEVIHPGSRGIFGIIGVKPAQVRAYIEIPDGEEKQHRRQEKPKREHRPEDRKRHNENQHKQKQKPEKKKEQPKEKAAAIPETELNMTLRQVAEGEDMSYEFIKTLISDIGLSAEASLYSCEDGTRRIIITGEDASTLIGHHGDTLDALQYLANLASARKNANGERDKSRVTVDIEGYRAKREATLRALARRMAAKALRDRRSKMLEPMSAYERRIIHSEIQSIEGVSTNSVGSDNNRRIVIFLSDKKPEGIFDEEKENAVTAEASVEAEALNEEALAEDADTSDTAEEQ